MKKSFLIVLLAGMFLINLPAYSATKHASAQKSSHKTSVKVPEYKGSHGKNGAVTPKSIGAGALSLLIWPGIGQLMNDEKNTDKVLTHAVLGLTGVFRIWSCYDGVANRKGGVWENRI